MIVEKDEDVIRLVGNRLANYNMATRDKIVVIHGDIFEIDPAKYSPYDYVWFDIWIDIDSSNLKEMDLLKHRFVEHTIDYGCWCEKECLVGKLKEEIRTDHIKIRDAESPNRIFM